ncbi:hypothetical protein MNBD_GAMMA12-3001 [hydrothermal vent metagenome]|uniref:FHA domain-containing protein n=1 Tax=hydrothermal vent metagenome TaxID=652676 RepID=A0A3B0Y582_9ZZZZ
MLKLLLTEDHTVIREFPLEPGVVTIGRGPGNEIRLEDMSVSSHHAQLDIEQNQYLETLNDICVKDLRSTNGTLINGKKVKRTRLRHGDIINIGAYQFRVVYDNEQALDSTRIYLPGA